MAIPNLKHLSGLPAVDGVAVTPSDTVDLAGGPCLGILATAAGNIAIVFPSGNSLTIPVNANTVDPFSAKRVKSTGTTATGIQAFY